MPVECYIGFGSNKADRMVAISSALRLLNEHANIAITKLSSIYETQPVGPVEQADFLNGVVCIETTLLPRQLLGVCQRIEQRLGRVRTIRWGPRVIDLDILLYDRLCVAEQDLIIPHPELANRRFVLEPLNEVASHVLVSGVEKTVYELLLQLDDDSRVQCVIETSELLSMIKKG